MASNMDLKAIKRRVLTSYFQDGLFELILGLSLALMGCLILIPNGASMAYLPIMLLSLCLPAAKKRYVAPRVGYVSLAPKKKGVARLTVALTLTALLGLAVFFLTATRNMPGWLGSSLSALFEFPQWGAVLGILLASMFSLFALRSGITRFYAFAFLFGIGAVVVALLKVTPGMRATILFVGPGSVVMIGGLIVFIRFLRSNPVLPEGDADGQE